MKQALKSVALLLVFGFHASCGQNNTGLSKGSNRAESKDTVYSLVPNSMVRHVRQARNGDILVASFKGVYRYDGKSFRHITSTIQSPSFWDVLEDRKGNLWFASKDSGLYYQSGNTMRHFTTRDGLADNRVGSIYEDRAGNVWFATGGGVSWYDGKALRSFTTKDGLSHPDVNTILEDRTGRIWIGTRGDACYYDGKSFTVVRNEEGRPFHNVWSIIEDRKGHIWLGGSIIRDKNGSSLSVESGLWRSDGSTFTKVTNSSVYAMIEDREGNIWTTGGEPFNGLGVWSLSRYEGRSLYDKQPEVREVLSIKKSGSLMGILEAQDGSIWIGAMSPLGNVYRYDGKAVTNFGSKAVQQ